ELQVVDGCEPAVLVGNACRTLLKLSSVHRRPPIAQVSLGVELAAFVIETMSQLVTNYGADTAEVHGVVEFLCEERRLEVGDRGGGCYVQALSIVVFVCRGH